MISCVAHEKNTGSDWVGDNAQAAVILPSKENIVIRRVRERRHRPEEGVRADPVRISDGLLVDPSPNERQHSKSLVGTTARVRDRAQSAHRVLVHCVADATCVEREAAQT
jgi:hypothetical protein